MINYTKIIYVARPTFLYPIVGPWLNKLALTQWTLHKKPPPPDAIKQAMIKGFAQKFSLSILVETGTFFGDTINALLAVFESIYSIELSANLYKKAVVRFSNESKVRLLHGDSGTIIKDLVPSLEKPSLFWLDAHYSRSVTARGKLETPIIEELKNILSLSMFPNLILIDDARLFGISKDFPTIEEVTCLVRSIRPDCSVTIKDDIICIIPPVGELAIEMPKLSER